MKADRIAKLKEFLKSDPDDSFSRYALALEYSGQGETHLAVTQLVEVLKRNPSYVAAYQQLGYHYRKLDRRDDAIAILKRGIGVAVESGDLHARSEMLEALDELEM